MTPFGWLCLSHFVADWMLQSDWMACGKRTKFTSIAGLTHYTIYTAVIALTVFLIFPGLDLPKQLLVNMFVFLSHWLIDGTNLVQQWMRWDGTAGHRSNAPSAGVSYRNKCCNVYLKLCPLVDIKLTRSRLHRRPLIAILWTRQSTKHPHTAPTLPGQWQSASTRTKTTSTQICTSQRRRNHVVYCQSTEARIHEAKRQSDETV